MPREFLRFTPIPLSTDVSNGLTRPSDDLLISTPRGLYCPPGDFFIDPWRPVDRAVVTHAHADHLRWGSKSYLVSEEGAGVTRVRLGPKGIVEALPWGASRTIGAVRVSLHPAGHILGAAQVRLEHKGQVAVVTGDFKRHVDPTTTPFEVVPCHLLVTESTFALPVFRWAQADQLPEDLGTWWRRNQSQRRTSVLFGYALGKAQRLLAALSSDQGPILIHGAVGKLNDAYRAAGVQLPATLPASPENARKHQGAALVIAPPSAAGGSWIRKFGPYSTAFASGWMQLRGTRRRRAADQGFVVSDHADWPGLVDTVRETGAERVLVTHGYTDVFVRWLREHEGLDAEVLATPWSGEAEEPAEAQEPEETQEPGETQEPSA